MSNKFFNRIEELTLGPVKLEVATSGGFDEFKLVAALDVTRMQDFNFSLDEDSEDGPMRTHVLFTTVLGYVRFSIAITI